MYRFDALEERLKKQERQIKTLSTQVEVLMQGMNELSLRQHSIKDTMNRHETSRSSPAPSPRFAAVSGSDEDGQLLARTAALEAKISALSEESGHRHNRIPSVALQSASAGTGNSEPNPSEGHHGHHVHGANKEAEDRHQSEQANKRESVITLGVLTAHRLDAGDMYEIADSVWDSCLFLGIPPLGRTVSALMAVMYVSNVFVQMAFVMIAGTFMVEPDVSTDTLDGLLRFRAGIAHSVSFADSVLQRSMAAQICGEDDKLHMSGAQRTLYSDAMAFSTGGPLLSLLAQLCWLGSMIKEVNAAYSFTRSVLQVPRGDCTEVITADSSADGLDAVDSITKEKEPGVGLPTGSLVALTVVTRLTTVSRIRLAWAVFGIALPRALLAISVGYVGTLFLATASAMSELVLNAIALAFIIELDEMLYALFAPRRLHTLMNNFEPLPMPPLRRCIPGVNSFLKMLFVATSIFLVKLLLLDPMFWRLTQAQNILCSGDTDFVYATNPATGMVHVTKSSVSQEWSEMEKTVLQVAGPKLESKYGWEVDQEILDLATSDFSMAVVTQWGASPASGGATLAESVHEPGLFQFLEDVSSYTVADMAMILPCVDREAGNTYAQADRFLERATGLLGFSCSNISRFNEDFTTTYTEFSSLCSDQGKVNIRALCPMACGCHAGKDGMTGLFNTVDYGCPLACTEYANTIDHFWYNKYKYDNYTQYYYSDGDVANSSRSRGSRKGVCQDALDAELVADPDASLACLTDFKRCLELTGRFTRWYAMYVRGIYPYVTSKWGTGMRLQSLASVLYQVGTLQVDSLGEYLWRYWMTDGVSVSLLDGNWMLTDSQAPHPRGLTGCRFLASYELAALLGFDLCSPNGLTSIRRVCPVSCGCTKGMDECPAACTDVEFDDDASNASTANASTANATMQ
jgi:hypothetical protein